jgi:tetratricopeptide (TPR) repeat protein
MDALDDEIGLVLTVLRCIWGWSQEDWARAARVGASSLSEYETGEKTPNLQTLERLFAALGVSLSIAGRTRAFIGEVRSHRAAASSFLIGPDAFAPVGQATANLSLQAAGLLTSDALGFRVPLSSVALPSADDRRAATRLWDRLKAYSAEARKALIAELEPFRNWALCERLCAESERAAAKDPSLAKELADLAMFAAERVSGEEAWRSRLQGYARAHLGNAYRVANDFPAADLAFAKSDHLWEIGAAADPGLLDPSRPLELKASLRRDERHLTEAVALLENAFAVRQSAEAAGRILVKKALTLEKLGEYEDAIAALREAAPWVEADRDPRLLFSLKFNLLVNLCHVGRFAEASTIVDEVRRQSAALGNGLDSLRVRWLEARVLAGTGRRDEAVSIFEAVREAFTCRTMAFDAALASLDVSMLFVEAGRTGEVKALAEEMVWIFDAQGVSREALAAFTLFSEAALREALSVELVCRYIEEFRKGASPGD